MKKLEVPTISRLSFVLFRLSFVLFFFFFSWLIVGHMIKERSSVSEVREKQWVETVGIRLIACICWNSKGMCSLCLTYCNSICHKRRIDTWVRFVRVGGKDFSLLLFSWWYFLKKWYMYSSLWWNYVDYISISNYYWR